MIIDQNRQVVKYLTNFAIIQILTLIMLIFQVLEMKNPFQNIDNYSIKTNYNRIRSRTKSKDSSKSSKVPNLEYPTSKAKQFIVGVQYRQKWKKAQQIQRKALKIYGPQCMRYNCFKNMPQSPPKYQSDYVQFPKIVVSPDKNLKNTRNMIRRDSQLTEMINIGSFQNLQSSNEYGSYYNINDSKNSIFQNKMRNLNRNCSIMQAKDPFKSFDQTESMLNSRTKVESNFYQSKYTANSNRYLQHDHIPDTINQLSHSKSNRSSSMKQLSDKSIQGSLRSMSSKSISSKSIKRQQRVQKINLQGKEYFFSEYYKN